MPEAAVRKHLKDLQGTFDKVEKRGKRTFDRHPGLVNDLKKQSARYRNAIKAEKSQAEIDREFREKIDMTVFTWDGPKEVKMSPPGLHRLLCPFPGNGSHGH